MSSVVKISDRYEMSLKEEETRSQVLSRTTYVAHSGPCYGPKWLHGAEPPKLTVTQMAKKLSDFNETSSFVAVFLKVRH
jgi:hypothetical protein